MKNIFFYKTAIGKLALVAKADVLTNLYFPDDKIPSDLQILETATHLSAAEQLEEYFAGRRKVFTLNLAPEGTEFMQTVWQELQKIPYGMTVSYKTVAENIGKNKAYRAVGLANNKNPLPIFIPCHRVVGSSGKLVGYRGGLSSKKYLLALEEINIS